MLGLLEGELINQRLAQIKGEMMKERLFNDNINLAYYVARKINIPNMSDDDKFQISLLALWKACKTYDPNRNLKFSTYASVCIKNELLMTKRKRSVDTISLDTPLKTEEEDLYLKDAIASNVDVVSSVQDDIMLVEINKLKEKHLSRMEQQVIDLYYMQGKTQVEISEILGVSQAQISRYKTKAINKLRYWIKEVL